MQRSWPAKRAREGGPGRPGKPGRPGRPASRLHLLVARCLPSAVALARAATAGVWRSAGAHQGRGGAGLAKSAGLAHGWIHPARLHQRRSASGAGRRGVGEASDARSRGPRVRRRLRGQARGLGAAGAGTGTGPCAYPCGLRHITARVRRLARSGKRIFLWRLCGLTDALKAPRAAQSRLHHGCALAIRYTTGRFYVNLIFELHSGFRIH